MRKYHSLDKIPRQPRHAPHSQPVAPLPWKHGNSTTQHYIYTLECKMHSVQSMWLSAYLHGHSIEKLYNNNEYDIRTS